MSHRRSATANLPDLALPPGAAAGDVGDILDVISITHPFHPWRGRKLQVVQVINKGTATLLRCQVDRHTIRCFPQAWTSARAVDNFERVSAGRALFRPDDLSALRVMVDVLLDGH